MADYFNYDQVWKELQNEADSFGGHMTPIKLVITDQNMPNWTDGFGTTITKFDPDAPDAAERLERLVCAICQSDKEGKFQWHYKAYPEYQVCFIDLNKVLIDWPNQGQAGGTVFGIYQHAVSEEIKQRIARTVARRFGARCSIVEGKGSGFLVEKLPGGDFLYQLASSCGCTVKEVLRRIRVGWSFAAPAPEVLAQYKQRVYFFVQYEIVEGEKVVEPIRIGYRKTGDLGDVIDANTPADVQAYSQPKMLKVSPNILEVRYRPNTSQFENDIDLDQDEHAIPNLGNLMMNQCPPALHQEGYSVRYRG
jgi:hypothetical protein